MASVQAEHVRASFLFVGNFNGQHEEWFGSSTTNLHENAAFNFATGFGCKQLVVGWTFARCGTFGLLIPNVHDLLRIAVVAPIGNSGHSSLSAVISMALAVPNLSLRRKCFLKLQINWNVECGIIQDLSTHNTWFDDNNVEVLYKVFLRLGTILQVGLYEPTRVNLVPDNDKPWFDDQCRRGFDQKQEAFLQCTHLQWTRDHSLVHWHEFVQSSER